MTENLPRRHQKIFAKNAGAQGTTVYGSTAAGNTQYATDIGMLQSDAWETGLEAGVITDKAPVLQDDNTVKKVVTQQLAYLFQKGIPEWEAQTTYFKGNLCMSIIDNIPNLYYSLIDNNINNDPTNSSNSWSKLQLGGQIIGQIISVMSTSSYIPSGCLPCNGSEYSKTQFLELWNNFLTASTPLLETCTYEEYQTSITNNGFCEKFAIDNVNNKFKVPTLNNVMYQNTDTTLPVVGNGKTISVTDGITNVGLYISSSANPVVSRPGLYGTDVGTANTGTGFNMHNKSIGFSPDKDASCLVAKNKANASINFFVVVANGEINQSQMDWSAWATSLQGKANTDLSNTASNIDYVIESGTNDNGWYRKYKSGWIEQGGTYTAAANNIRTITFPTPFTTEVKSIQITSGSLSNAGNGYITEVSSNTLTSFNAIIGAWTSSNPSDVRRFWEAKGF